VELPQSKATMRQVVLDRRLGPKTPGKGFHVDVLGLVPVDEPPFLGLQKLLGQLVVVAVRRQPGVHHDVELARASQQAFGRDWMVGRLEMLN
jgi:hypothetical protein